MQRISKPHIVDLLRYFDRNRLFSPRIRYASVRSKPELIADIKSGFLVTELIGMGVNMVSGDYSRGATGFWIENGEIAYPVSEMTVAGNLKKMFANLTPADDLQFRFGTDAPSIRIDGMTVAGV